MSIISSSQSNRREFIAKSFSSCAFCFLAAPLLSASNAMNSDDLYQDHKFNSASGMSHQQVCNYAFKGWYIPAMKNLMSQIGKDEFLVMLKKSSEMIQSNSYSKLSPEQRTMSALVKMVKKYYGSNPKLTFEMVSESENEVEFNYTECIWAKTFREANAEEIGYAGMCYQDYPLMKAFNPSFKLVRTKTLMQGHDCCNFKVVREV